MSDRFVAVEGSGHQCCMDAHVEDTTKPTMIAGKQWLENGRPTFETICECHDIVTARIIAVALNRLEAP